MNITLEIKDEVMCAIKKIADLDNRSVDEAIGEAIRIYLQGTFDELVGDFFELNPENPQCPILEK